MTRRDLRWSSNKVRKPTLAYDIKQEVFLFGVLFVVFCKLTDLTDQTAEYKLMDRIEPIPV